MKWNTFVCGAIALSTVLLVGCSSPGVKNEADRQVLSTEASAALTGFKNEDPTLQPLLDKAVGYAIFPQVGKAGFVVGASHGRGEVFENGRKVGYADITQGTVGLQIGAQTFDELLVFLRPQDLQEFKSGDFKLAGNVSAVAIKAGAAGTADASKGLVAFVRTKGGLMAEASIGGQQFRYTPISAQ